MSDSNPSVVHSSWKLTLSALWLLQAINFIAWRAWHSPERKAR